MSSFLAMAPYTDMRQIIKQHRVLDKLNAKLRLTKGKLPSYGVGLEEFYSWMIGPPNEIINGAVSKSIFDSRVIKTSQVVQVMRRGAVANDVLLDPSVGSTSYLPKPDPAGRSILKPTEVLKSKEYMTRKEKALLANIESNSELFGNDFYFMHANQTFLWSLNKVCYLLPKGVWQMDAGNLLDMPTDPLKNCPQWCTFIGLTHNHDMLSPIVEENTMIGLGIFYGPIKYADKDLFLITLAVRPKHIGHTPICLYWVMDLEKPSMIEALEACDDLDFEKSEGKFGVRIKKDGGAPEGLNAAFADVINAILFVNTEHREQVEKKEPMFKRQPRRNLKSPFILDPRPNIVEYQVYEEMHTLITRQGSQSFTERRSHIRKGHWHGYWTGPRNSDSRVYITKWVMPTFVRGSKAVEAESTTNEVVK